MHDIERIGQKIRAALFGHGQTGVVGMGAMAAIDMALWDLNAQALGVPVSRLLGGTTRARVPYPDRCRTEASRTSPVGAAGASSTAVSRSPTASA